MDLFYTVLAVMIIFLSGFGGGFSLQKGHLIKKNKQDPSSEFRNNKLFTFLNFIIITLAFLYLGWIEVGILFVVAAAGNIFGIKYIMNKFDKENAK